MKPLIILALITFCLAPITSHAQVQWRNGYTHSNGKYVQGHYQTRSDGNRWNNYSTKGNINPFTGQKGTVAPYRIPSGSTYSRRRSSAGYSSRRAY